MNRHSLPYRFLAALLSVTMLAGVALPAVQHACAAFGHHADHSAGHSAEHTAPAAMENGAVDHEAMMHGTMGHGTMGHGDAATASHSTSKAPHAPCQDTCADGDCCTVRSAPDDALDLRLSQRVLQEDRTASLPPARTLDRVAVPTPDRASHPPAEIDSRPSVSSVRLHVWTATFLK